jgi:hypothetical protein
MAGSELMRSFLAIKRLSDLTALRLNLERIERHPDSRSRAFGELLLGVVDYVVTRVSVISR